MAFYVHYVDFNKRLDGTFEVSGYAWQWLMLMAFYRMDCRIED